MDNAKDKINISVWGSCVSRDAVIFDNFNVVRYAGFVSPYTMFSGTPANLTGELSGYWSRFGTRCLCLDVNKNMDEYFKEAKSDWLFLDVLSARHDILYWRDKNVFITKHTYAPEQLSVFENKFGASETIDALDIPLDEMRARVEQMCDRVLKVYEPEQIIFNEVYPCEDYISRDGQLMRFSEEIIEKVRKRKILFKSIYEVCKCKFAGCHVIKMPEGVFCDEAHRWIIMPLHYFYPYYEYVSRSIETINKRLPAEEEQSLLNELCEDCGKKFAAWRKQL